MLFEPLSTAHAHTKHSVADVLMTASVTSVDRVFVVLIRREGLTGRLVDWLSTELMTVLIVQSTPNSLTDTRLGNASSEHTRLHYTQLHRTHTHTNTHLWTHLLSPIAQPMSVSVMHNAVGQNSHGGACWLHGESSCYLISNDIAIRVCKFTKFYNISGTNISNDRVILEMICAFLELLSFRPHTHTHAEALQLYENSHLQFLIKKRAVALHKLRSVSTPNG